MKVAISIPDSIFVETEAMVAALGTSRSQFFALAAQHYLEHLGSNSITDQINAAVATVGNGGIDPGAAGWTAAAGRRLLDREPW